MKKLLLLLTLSIASLFVVSATNQYFTDLKKQFNKMGEDISGAVTSNATSGLVWSDAYIGNLPHFGVGVFTGVSIIPLDAFGDVLTVVDPNAAFPSELKDAVGLPLPTIGLDARIGGFIAPFDIGVKYAVISDLEFQGVTFDYSLIGADFRYAIIDGNLLLPNVSVGVGFSRLTTDISISGILGGNYEVYSGSIPTPKKTITALKLKDPDLVYGWEANVIDFKAQISKGLIFITPYAGINAAYGMTSVGGGLKTALVDQDNKEITTVEAKEAISALDLGVDLNGFEEYVDTTGWAFKVNGGFSLNLFLAKIDIGVNYDLFAKTYGGQVGFRLQL